MLATDQWAYLHGKPESTGRLKVNPEDFLVREQLGYAPCGEGEHIYLWIRKTGLNTAFVAEQIAKFCQLPLRAITYAGRKDKHAVTEQWIGVHKPGKHEYNWDEFQLEGLEILSAIRHNKKLRTGVLKGNQFEILAREVSHPEDVQSRLEKIKHTGVPNYYGQQRFGESRHHAHGSNLALAEKILEGEEIRNRNKRSMAISALRSWLFNEFISQRLSEDCYTSPKAGDAFMLAGSNSFFVEQQIDATLIERIASKDIQLSAPLWGKGKLDTDQQAKQWELAQAEKRQKITEALEQLGLKQERRAISLYPENMTWQFTPEGLKVQFTLPSGCFATSVIRELLNLLPVEESQ